MNDLHADAIRWELEPVPRTNRFDLLALTQDELLDAARAALDDRDAYRLLACEALAALRDLTLERDRLRSSVREQAERIRTLMRLDARGRAA